MPQLGIQGRPAGRCTRSATHFRQAKGAGRTASPSAQVFESSLDAIFIADERACRGASTLGASSSWVRRRRGGQSAGDDALFAMAQDDAEFMAEVRQGWEQTSFWEGELRLRHREDEHCCVQLSWVALRDDAA